MAKYSLLKGKVSKLHVFDAPKRYVQMILVC